jgi:hypothetical protein
VTKKQRAEIAAIERVVRPGGVTMFRSYLPLPHSAFYTAVLRARAKGAGPVEQEQEGEMPIIGENIVAHVEGGFLVLRIELATDLGLSSSGKTRLVATSRGSVAVPGTDVKLGLNVFRKEG